MFQLCQFTGDESSTEKGGRREIRLREVGKQGTGSGSSDPLFSPSPLPHSSRPSIFKNKNQHVIVMARSLNAFINNSATLGTHPRRCFDCDRKDRNVVFSFIRRLKRFFPEETFSFSNFSNFTKGTVFPLFKVVYGKPIVAIFNNMIYIQFSI